MSFTANYPGECDDCGGEIKDTEIVYADELGRRRLLVHVQCLDSFVRKGDVR
jgi:hypothetical protein